LEKFNLSSLLTYWNKLF